MAVTSEELWKLVFKKLVFWSVKKHRLNHADAQETVQAAIRQFLQAGGIADPANPRALLEALGSRINGIAVNRRRNMVLKSVGLTLDGSLPEASGLEDPEQRISGADIARKAVSTLLNRVEEDSQVLAIVMQISDGVEEPAEQARILGLDIRDVYRARRRLKTHVDAVKQMMEDW